MIGHILRFDARYVQVFHAARPDNLGRPIHLRAKRNAIRSVARRLGTSSSILFYMGVHDVDAMQWIGRSKIAKVYAQKREALGTGNEDALYAVLNFENGAIGSLDYSWAWPDGLMNGFRSAFEIVGTQSAAALDVSDQGLSFVTDAGTTGGDTHLWPEINGRIAGGLADEIDHFVDCDAGRHAIPAALSGGVRRHPGAGCAGGIRRAAASRSRCCDDAAGSNPTG